MRLWWRNPDVPPDPDVEPWSAVSTPNAVRPAANRIADRTSRIE
jgi:hypothetical protein